jgi:hypothetical protein
MLSCRYEMCLWNLSRFAAYFPYMVVAAQFSHEISWWDVMLCWAITSFAYEIFMLLWFKEVHSGVGVSGVIYVIRRMCGFFGLSQYFDQGYSFRLPLLGVECERNRPSFLRQCFMRLPPSTETSISGTSRKLQICLRVSLSMIWRDVNSCFCDWRVQSGVLGWVVRMWCIDLCTPRPIVTKYVVCDKRWYWF